MVLNIENIVVELEIVIILELSELVKVIEEKFDVLVVVFVVVVGLVVGGVVEE